jgi:hypothetical protein
LKRTVACAALLVCPLAWAELSIEELDAQPAGTNIAELFQLGSGEVLLRLRGSREVSLPKTDGRWSAVYVLSADGNIKQRIELPQGLSQLLVPYLNGFAVQWAQSCAPGCSADGPVTRIVAYRHAADSQPRVLYERQPEFHGMLVVAAPDAQDLYVFEAGTMASRLTRIDSSGRVAWQKPIGWIETSSFVATGDGVALAQYASEQDPTMVLRALDRDGRLRWETPLSIRPSQQALFSPAGFVTLPMMRSPGEQRLMNFDVRSGELIADVDVQPFSRAFGTSDGLLLAGPMLGNSYLGMVGSDGRFSWLRRYVPDREISEIRGAVITREGKLLLASQESNPTALPMITSVIVTDRAAVSLGEARGRCLQEEWTEAVELAARLQDAGLYVEPPNAAELSTRSASCTAAEARFIAFMQGLAAVLPQSMPSGHPRQTTSVRPTAAGEPLRLESYTADRSGYPSAMVMLTFAAPYDDASGFWRVVSSAVLPHLDRMRALDDRFAQITGLRYVTYERNELNYEQTLAELEKAARVVDQRIASIAPDKLAEFRRTGPYGYVQLMLGLEGFGAGTGSMYPVAQADRTVLDIIEQNRRDAEQGNITIRD